MLFKPLMIVLITLFTSSCRSTQSSGVRDNSTEAAPQSASQFSCPDKISIKYGTYSQGSVGDNLASVQTLQALSGKTVSYTKSRGVKVCYYKAEHHGGFQIKLVNYAEGKSLKISRKFSKTDNIGYYTEVEPHHVRQSRLGRRNAKFSHFELIFDEDGCAFGQVPCGEFPEEFGESNFGSLVVTW